MYININIYKCESKTLSFYKYTKIIIFWLLNCCWLIFQIKCVTMDYVKKEEEKYTFHLIFV